MAAGDEHPAVTKFRDYLRINTEQPKPDYYGCKDFLYAYAKELGLEPWSHECVPGKPIVGMTLKGRDASLPSLLLYSHTDVVPTFPEHWTHPPYSAHKDTKGDIYARGTQDMKSVGIQYMEALRELIRQGKAAHFLRTIHVVWGPDEEIGSHDAMEMYVHTEHFRQLNVGFALDEGLASENEVYRLFRGQRCVWWFKVTCPGNPGHGSRFIENTAGPKLHSIISSAQEFRRKQQYLLDSSPQLTPGDVTSINLTKIEGGVQVNVIPEKFVAWFDMRVTPTEDLKEREALIAEWCRKAGAGVTYEFLQQGLDKTLSPSTKEDPWWKALTDSLDEENCKYVPEIFIGGTDARFLRTLGIRAIGFSPIVNTPILLHDHNEFLNERVFLKGLQLYTRIIERMANLAAE